MVRSRMRSLILLSALFICPVTLHAQEDFLSFDQPNELMARTDRPEPGTNPGSSPADLKKYVKILRAVEMAVSFQTKNNGSGHKIGGLELSSGSKIDARVRFKKKNGKVYLDELSMVPTGTMKFAGKRVNKITFNSKGVLHVDVKGMPDLRITNIEKKRNGDTRLHLRGLPDITIKKDGRVKMMFFNLGDVDADFEMPDWPPTLEGLMKMTEKKPGAKKTDLTSIVSTVKWTGNATVDGDKLDLSGEVAKLPKGTYNLALNGEARNVNGRLESMGHNRATVKVHFNRGGRVNFGPTDADVIDGGALITGLYRFSVPLKDSPGERVNFAWDGKAKFNFKGRNVDVFLPGNTKVYAENGEVEGAVDHRFTYGPEGSSFEVTKGTYDSTFRGPLRIERFNIGGFKVDPLTLSGTINMSGDVTTRSGLIVHRGKATVRTKVETDGMASAIAGNEVKSKVTLLKGSKINADIERFTTFTPLSPSRDVSYGNGTNIAGNLDLDLILGETEVRTDAVDLRLPHGPNLLSVGSDLNIRKRGDRIDVRRGSLSISGSTGADGYLVLKTATSFREEGTVTSNRLNARSGPSLNNARLSSFTKGTKLKIIKKVEDVEGNTWYFVSGSSIAGRELSGFVHGDYVKVDKVAGDSLNFNGQIKKGTSVDFNLEGISDEEDVVRNFAEVIRRAKGGLKAHLKLGSSDLSLGALKASIKNGEAVLSGSANDGLDGTINLGDTRLRAPGTDVDLRGSTNLRLNGGARSENGRRKAIKMEFEIKLRSGSKITMTKPGSNTKVTIKGDDSHLTFEALATTDANGKPAIQELKNVDLRLELGDAATNFLGRSVSAPGEKIITLKQGRIVFLDNGIDIFGDFAVHVRSRGNTPAVSIRW
jgi:hypothetical protein